MLHPWLGRHVGEVVTHDAIDFLQKGLLYYEGHVFSCIPNFFGNEKLSALLETGVELLDGHLGCRQRPYVMRRRRPPRRVGARRTVLEYFFLLTTKKVVIFACPLIY
jgi:hypothetical protein